MGQGVNKKAAIESRLKGFFKLCISNYTTHFFAKKLNKFAKNYIFFGHVKYFSFLCVLILERKVFEAKVGFKSQIVYMMRATDYRGRVVPKATSMGGFFDILFFRPLCKLFAQT